MIEEGDVVVLQSGERAIVEDIDKIVYDEPITVYNFEVEDFHTYFVSNASVLVHNMCAQQVGTKLTSKEAKKLAESMGFYRINETSHGQAIFYSKKKKKYITADVDKHNGGVWKMASSIKGLASKKTRDGTFDRNLKQIGK